MVKFEFTVTDEEADLIMSCMNDARLRAFEAATFGTLGSIPVEYVDWHRRHSQLIAELMRKMKSTRG